jgi:hypothetical protein
VTATVLPSATATATITLTSTPVDTPTATASPTAADPGVAPWTPVPANEVAETCGLDPDLLAAADPIVGRPYVVVRYGKLCHEYYPTGMPDESTEVFSTTKTMGAVVTGIAAYQTRDLPRGERKTGPLSDEDRVDFWLDEFTFNPDAHVAHVLAMVAHNADLSYGHKMHMYDTVGTVQINRLSDVINAAVLQDPDRLGANIEEFTQRYLFGPVGMRDSVWNSGLPTKVFAFTWHSTVRDMARLGLLMLRDGLWSGERLLDASWIYRMTHPSFEDANTGYGYLTWLNADSNWTFGLGDGLLGASHTVRYGAGYRKVDAYTENLWPGNGILGLEQARNDLRGQVYRQGNGGNRVQYFDTYAGDTLPLNRVTIDFGVRYDRQWGSALPSGTVVGRAIARRVQLDPLALSGRGMELDLGDHLRLRELHLEPHPGLLRRAGVPPGEAQRADGSVRVVTRRELPGVREEC